MELQELLLAREQRALYQEELLKRYSYPLVCLTMNIPGPEKNNSLITQAFLLGERRLMAQFPNRLYEEHRILPTGCEGYYVIPQPPEEIKTLCMLLEAQEPLGRLLDLDVLTPGGEKLSRPTPRSCLLCQEDARLCRRRGTHSIQDIARKATAILQETLDLELAEQIGALAIRSLLYELLTTPKPGLVDMNNNGSHSDMDPFTFAASAAALTPYFRKCASEGIHGRDIPAEALLPTLRYLGREAESAMFAATKGINTHKGAIFSLGLLCAAAGRLGALPSPDPADENNPEHLHTYHTSLPSLGGFTLPTASPEALCKEAATIVKGITERDLCALTEDSALTKGQKLFLSHGLTGARGQAEAGFPAVLQTGLPLLKAGLEQGFSIHRSGVGALLAMLAEEPDTALISRSSFQRYALLRRDLQTILRNTPYPTEEILLTLDKEFISENLSPGGSADLLALCYFLSGEVSR